MTSSVMVPKKKPQLRRAGDKAERRHTDAEDRAQAHKLARAFWRHPRGVWPPRCWLVTTAPPVASAPNSVMISWLIISTSDTPEIAASPTDDTITVSAMPTRISSICSMMSGQSSVSSWRLVNSLSFFNFYNASHFPSIEYSTKKAPAQCGGQKRLSPEGGRLRVFTHTAALRSGQAWRPCWRDNSRRTRRWPY